MNGLMTLAVWCRTTTNVCEQARPVAPREALSAVWWSHDPSRGFHPDGQRTEAQLRGRGWAPFSDPDRCRCNQCTEGRLRADELT
jgi:hypothetical protein